jgi:predicted hydrocarbon binding protein
MSRDEEKGWILEGDTRIISFRVKTFQAVLDALKGLIGSKVASVLAYRMGLALGHAGLCYSRDLIHTEQDLVTVLDQVFRHRGWGRCLSLEGQRKMEKTVYVCTVAGDPECYERTSSEPVCDMLRGAIVGWLEGYLDKKTSDSVERECRSMGHEFCVFEASF